MAWLERADIASSTKIARRFGLVPVRTTDGAAPSPQTLSLAVLPPVQLSFPEPVDDLVDAA